jgi:signal transduction histidine kinase
VQAIGGTVTLLNGTGPGATFVVRLPMTSVLHPLELARTATGFQL